MRHPLIIGNWKLNGNKHMVNHLITALRNKLSNIIGCDVAIAPPMIYLDKAKYNLADSRIALCAQNVDLHVSGAFTGEISANMLKDIGVKYIIIGHFERRSYHKESNQDIADKFAIIKNEGLIPVLCIGESKAENDAHQTEAVCASQLDAVLNRIGAKAFENSVIAYEPLWAISTGKSANPFQAQTVHKFIRDYLVLHDNTVAEQVIIQYGGSVNAGNAAAFFTQPDIDGALVGGASLNADVFAAIVKAAVQAKQKLALASCCL
ncbi:triose-phosphate isomerase [Candidatus Palibaumannia cicadellinicola]|uniref:Triosephosphate isomerase n=1 Tax=Candidatus Palibaumannia cicadellinicola TaxID=186490 RepID=A0A088N143_9GAMM|nr:triose-phosphate isomerase [Candidatus Baumannia cicadellinicola]AIN47071.1 Triosephosphate isomerase [Candidatus Baumannia cicadellinicola]